VHEHTLRVALRAELAAAVSEGTDEFLLLGVDADDRLAQGQLQLDGGVEMGELGVAVGVVGPSSTLRLAWRL